MIPEKQGRDRGALRLTWASMKALWARNMPSQAKHGFQDTGAIFAVAVSNYRSFNRCLFTLSLTLRHPHHLRSHVYGTGVPKPVTSFDEASFPS